MLTDLPPLPQCDILDPGRFGVAWQEESVRAYGQACQAATLATVTPLLRQVMWAMTTCGVNDGYEGPRQCFDEDQIDAAKEAIGAFLSGATKESTDHGTHEI